MAPLWLEHAVPVAAAPLAHVHTFASQVEPLLA
jgi:hypothetical protein